MAWKGNGPQESSFQEMEWEEEKEEDDDDNYDDGEDDDDYDDDDDKEEERMGCQMRKLPTPPLLAQHRGEMIRLLESLLSFHRWKDAAGIVSQLFQSSPPGTVSGRQLRRLFMAACEIDKQLGDGNDFHDRVKHIFVAYIKQMHSPEMNAMAKLDVANFYFSRGEYEEAYAKAKSAQITWSSKNLAQDIRGRGNPLVNLILGRICYKRWYRDAIPEDMKIQSHDASGAGCEERGISQSDIEAGFGSPLSSASLEDSSIFLARGLDARLLPVKLRPMHEDLNCSIQEYRQLANDVVYEEGVQCLRNALRSSPLDSVSLDSLQPLIQLLLLGDRVAEAAAELNNSCHRLNYSAVPFSLRARFLECFVPQEIVAISSCYQAALRIDATCSSYVEGIIRLHRNRNDEHSMMVLLEMIPEHIDAVVPYEVSVGHNGQIGVGRDVKTNVWEGLASCFFNVSSHFHGRIISEILSKRMRATWERRFHWWKEKHFKEITLSSQARSRMPEQACMSDTMSGTGALHVTSDSSKPQDSEWENHYELDPYNRKAARCKYCKMDVRGGIQRMKHHLVGKKKGVKSCNSVPTHVRMELEKLLNGKDREKQQSALSLLPLLPGDDELLARKAACACHLYGPSNEYVVEVLKVLTMHRINDQISYLHEHMQNALNFCATLGSW